MGVYEAHGPRADLISNFKSILSLKNFSVAEFDSYSEDNAINPFSHSHLEYEFIIPLDTLPLVECDRGNYIGEVGYVYPINPNVEHGIVLPLKNCACFDITVSKEFFDILKDIYGFNECYFNKRYPLPSDLIEKIRGYQEEMSNPNFSKTKVQNYARLIVYSLIKAGARNEYKPLYHIKSYKRNIKNIISYMASNFSNPELDMDSLSLLSGYSNKYFTRAFKAYMNDTPIKSLNIFRLSKAKSLINKGKVSLLDISKQVGYKNLSSFTEAFKRYNGYTPSEYKRMVFYHYKID